MSAGKYNFVIEQGATFTRRLTWRNANQSLVDTSGCSAVMQVRRLDNDALVSEFSTTNGSILFPPKKGVIDLNFSWSATGSIPADKYKFDILVTMSDGSKRRLLEGFITVKESVTKNV